MLDTNCWRGSGEVVGVRILDVREEMWFVDAGLQEVQGGVTNQST